MLDTEREEKEPRLWEDATASSVRPEIALRRGAATLHASEVDAIVERANPALRRAERPGTRASTTHPTAQPGSNCGRHAGRHG